MKVKEILIAGVGPKCVPRYMNGTYLNKRKNGKIMDNPFKNLLLERKAKSINQIAYQG